MAVAKYTVRIAKKSRRSFSTKSGAELFIQKLVVTLDVDPATIEVVSNEDGRVLRPVSM